ncbi:hypothetical protein DFJ73DRAFT_844959 [Zopfochytrium polystomum]|nr:hypothetical protein DFJ73DRAFT_844959 [Zopfochytrium polystomum]
MEVDKAKLQLQTESDFSRLLDQLLKKFELQRIFSQEDYVIDSNDHTLFVAGFSLTIRKARENLPVPTSATPRLSIVWKETRLENGHPFLRLHEREEICQLEDVLDLLDGRELTSSQCKSEILRDVLQRFPKESFRCIGSFSNTRHCFRIDEDVTFFEVDQCTFYPMRSQAFFCLFDSNEVAVDKCLSFLRDIHVNYCVHMLPKTSLFFFAAEQGRMLDGPQGQEQDNRDGGHVLAKSGLTFNSHSEEAHEEQLTTVEGHHHRRPGVLDQQAQVIAAGALAAVQGGRQMGHHYSNLSEIHHQRELWPRNTSGLGSINPLISSPFSRNPSLESVDSTEFSQALNKTYHFVDSGARFDSNSPNSEYDTHVNRISASTRGEAIWSVDPAASRNVALNQSYHHLPKRGTFSYAGYQRFDSVGKSVSLAAQASLEEARGDDPVAASAVIPAATTPKLDRATPPGSTSTSTTSTTQPSSDSHSSPAEKSGQPRTSHYRRTRHPHVPNRTSPVTPTPTLTAGPSAAAPSPTADSTVATVLMSSTAVKQAISESSPTAVPGSSVGLLPPTSGSASATVSASAGSYVIDPIQRQKNKEAAARYRRRKNEEIQEQVEAISRLNARVQELETENKVLQTQVRMLKEQVAMAQRRPR